MRKTWPGSFTERIYVTWAVLAVFTLSTGLALLTPENRYLFGPIDYHIRAKHATVAAQLRNVPGEHLVLVRYGIHHEIYEELVYNGADIDRSKIVWARSLGSEKDQRLIQYYAGRQVWSLEEDGEVKLSRYSPPTNSVAARVTGND
jgi:hypothetical protein